MEVKTNHRTVHATDLQIYRDQALVLLQQQKTMALAVAKDDRPWIAPVFFVYVPPGIYFFSSPRSKHIQVLRKTPVSAGAIYADSDQLRAIQGLQMVGHVEEIQNKLERLNITARYLKKFPLARELLTLSTTEIGDSGLDVGLFVFRPMEIHCTNNRLGFGRRVQIHF